MISAEFITVSPSTGGVRSPASIMRSWVNVVMVVCLLIFIHLLLMMMMVRTGTPFVDLPPRLVVIIILPFTRVIRWAATGSFDVHWRLDDMHWFLAPVVGQNLKGIIIIMINWSTVTFRFVLRVHNDDNGSFLFLLFEEVQEWPWLNLILRMVWKMKRYN